MVPGRVYKLGTSKKSEHDREFVSRARERRRLCHSINKERRMNTRRINEERSFAFWVRKMQRKAQSLINQQLKKKGLLKENLIRL